MDYIEGITYIENFHNTPADLFEYLKQHVTWDERMSARKTASYGVAYNYSQIAYPYQELPTPLKQLCIEIDKTIGFEPNNCLINYYLDGKSKMGFHSDQTDILEHDTGVVIISLGATRVLRFRNIIDPEIIFDYSLPSGSLIYMDQKVQDEWLHAIPKADTDAGRMSLTFRKMR